MAGEIGGDDTLGRFFDVLGKSEKNSTPTKRNPNALDRTTSEPQMIASFDSEDSATDRGRRRRPSLQEFHSLSQKGLDTSRKLARRALLKRGAGHRRVASLLTSIDETALEGVVPEDGQLQYSDRRSPGGTNGQDTRHSNVDNSGTDTNTQDSNNKKPLDWGDGSWNTDMDKFLTTAMRLDSLFVGSTEFQEPSQEMEEEGEVGDITGPETIPLLHAEHPSNSAPQSSTFDRGLMMRMGRKKNHWKRLAKRLCCYGLNPLYWMSILIKLGRNSFALLVGLPAAITSWILFYYLHNPELDFLPGNASLSWWLNFFCRQMCTLDLARLTEYLYIDSLSLSTAFSIKSFGPYFTLASIQTKGWPFIFCFWALWNLVLLHGDNEFQVHWLYRTGLAIYSTANSGSYMLSSEQYLRFLLAIVVIGISMGIKRTFVALHFGRRTLTNFKPKLEALLQDIVLVAEVAELAEEASKNAQQVGATTSERTTNRRSAEVDLLGKKSSPRIQLPGVTFHDTTSIDTTESVEDDTDLKGEGIINQLATSGSTGNLEERIAHKQTPITLNRSYSAVEEVKRLLETWKEPINKLDKDSSEASIGDILKFRKALEHMDSNFPFGDSFGPAWTRDECIASAQNTYYRLLSLTRITDDDGEITNKGENPDLSISFDILRLLASDEDGMEIPEKVRAYSRLFRPDIANEVTKLAFIQSCDAVYRRLRYFRASVGNASLIDKVLEDFVGNVFAFVLGLLVLAILNFNPWPLLASISAVLVSFAFAFGPSAANYFDGMLLIIGRRPYDIGDRIVIAPPQTVGNNYDPRGDSWFVEDINLFTTTLRRARDSSVATVNNSSIVQKKIVNCQRSPNAQVVLELKFHMKINEDGNIEKFHAAVEQYVRSNPRSWQKLKALFMTELDVDNEYAIYNLSAIHRLNWQDAVNVSKSKGQLMSFCAKVSIELGFAYDSPVPRRQLFYGGGSTAAGTTISDLAEESPPVKNDALPEPGSDEAIHALLLQK